MPSNQCYLISNGDADDVDDDAVDDDDGDNDDDDADNVPYRALWPLVHVLGLKYTFINK